MTNFWRATALLLGTAIGAGIFAMPYAVSRVGFAYGGIYIVVLGLITMLTILLYGEVVLRTKKREQMTGYALTYLGPWGKRIITLSLVFGLYGALIAYIIEEGVFLHSLLGSWLGGNPMFYSLVFFALAAAAVFRGLKTIAWLEGILVAVLIGVMAAIVALSARAFSVTNLVAPDFSLTDLFLPYGVILFAFGAAAIVPDIAQLLRGTRQRRTLKEVIIFGMGLTLVLYFVFTLMVVGVSGLETTEGAVIGLGAKLGGTVVVVGTLFGVLTMTTSFMTLGQVLKEVFFLDYGVPKFWAWFLAMSVPLIIFLLQLTSFVEVIAIAGAIMGGLEGIIILFMWEKAQTMGDRQPEYHIPLSWPIAILLFLTFALGIIYQIWFTFFS